MPARVVERQDGLRIAGQRHPLWIDALRERIDRAGALGFAGKSEGVVAQPVRPWRT